MEYFRGIINLFSRKKSKRGKKEISTVVSPVTNQTVSNNSNPHFITHVHQYPATGIPPGSPTVPTLRTSTYGTESGTPSQIVKIGTSAFDPVEWVLAKLQTAEALSDTAVVGGYDHDGSPLWVIRTRRGDELLPGKLNIYSRNVYVADGLVEVMTGVFEVCCIPREKVKWVDASNGDVPKNAVVGGKTSDGEKLYIGRATYEGSLIPGKIQPSHKCCYVTFAYKAHIFKSYEVLCVV